MKILYLLFIPVLLFTTNSFAENGTYEESIYVVHQKNRAPVPEEDLAVDCAWATELYVSPVGGFTSDLYSVQSKKTNGVLLKDKIKKVGQLSSCFDAGSFEYERSGAVLTYDFGQAWLLILEGQQYIVTGMSRLRTNPEVDNVMGIPGAFLGISTGTIFTPDTILLDPPVPIGSFSNNYIAYIPLHPTLRGEGILTFRFFSHTGNGSVD